MELRPEAPNALSEHLAAFSAAVDFTDPFVVGCLVFDMCFIVIVLGSLWWTALQKPLFFGSLFLAYTLEWVNAFCAGNWRLIAKQNYFDSHGLFLTVFLGGPLLAGAFVILVSGMVDFYDSVRREAAG